MFEKESEEYAENNAYKYANDYITCQEAYQSGAEFGYNKANEWHKVADGDLPKNRRNIYVAYLNGYNEIVTTIASFRHKFWVFDGHKTECEVIAWCELPKYIEE